MNINEKIKCINGCQLIFISFVCFIYLLLCMYDNMCVLILYIMNNLTEDDCKKSDVLHYYIGRYFSILNN